MKTYATKKRDIKREWHLVDLKGKILGRQASRIAQLLMGKKNPYFAPYLDCGDYVVAINAGKIAATGRKFKQKKYQRHSGYPGGFKELTLKQMMAKDPRKVVELAVKGMLPKNKLQKPRMRRLKVAVGEEHGYEDKVKPKIKNKKPKTQT